MDKRAYLNRLSDNLERYVPDRERWDILQWYDEYFKDAGEGNEQAVIEELGDPAALARRLAEERGYGEKRKGPRLWQIALGAVVVVAVAIPLMAFSPLAAFLGFRGMIRDPAAAYPSSVPVEEYPSFEDPGAAPLIEVNISGSGVNVVLHPEDVDSPSVRTHGMSGDGDNLDWYFDGYTLNVNWYGDGESGARAAGTLEVAIPAAWELGTVNVSLDGAGDVTVSDLRGCEELIADANVGNISAENITGVRGYLSLYTSVGDIAFAGLPAAYGSTYLSAETGDVSATLYCAEKSITYDCSTGVGKVTVDGADCGSGASFSAGSDQASFFNACTNVGDVALTFDPEAAADRAGGQTDSGIDQIEPSPTDTVTFYGERP